MAAIYKYYLNGYEYTPTNTGGFTFDYNLNRENGAYHFSKSVNGSINFNMAAYEYISSFLLALFLPIQYDTLINS